MKLLQGNILFLLLTSLGRSSITGTVFSYGSDGVDQKSLVGGGGRCCSVPQFTFRELPLKRGCSSSFAELSVCRLMGSAWSRLHRKDVCFHPRKRFAFAEALTCALWPHIGARNRQYLFWRVTIWE